MPMPRTATAVAAEPLPQEPRTYAVTAGRTRTDHLLRIKTQLAATDDLTDEALRELQVEARQILHAMTASGRPSVSVAEIAVSIARPVWAARVLIGDLLGLGALVAPPSSSALPERDPRILRRVLHGLRQLA
jgi:hypothetical protein